MAKKKITPPAEIVSLREIREACQITQTALAEKVGVPQSEISRFELRPNPTLLNLKRYVEALNGDIEVWAIIEGHRLRIA